MKPALRNRLLAVGALVVAAGGLALISLGNLGENLVYYWSPSEMLSHGEKAYSATIRLGGVVKPGTIAWNSGAARLAFQVADDHQPTSKSVPVHSTEVPPQMFREGIGVVVEGTFDASGVFTSNRLMVNHSNEYRAPKEGEKPRDWKETVSDLEPKKASR